MLNRRALDARLESAWARAEHEGVPFGLIFCDLDHFKRVNDTQGHAVGDRVLAQAACNLSRSLRGGDAVGRYGGEEFLAVIDSGAEETLALVARRLRRMLASDAVSGVAVTASFGVASSTRFASLADLIASADRALYEVKRRGRDCCVLAASATDLRLLTDGEA
ncbi:MAG: GGDEF domain-containing protein [Vicinamibacterales bacterium]